MIVARIATLEAPRKLIFKTEQIDHNMLGDSELLCETLVSVISPGTEVAAYIGAPALRPGVNYPRLVGYCNVARVLRSGSSAGHIREGDRILTFTSHRSHFLINSSDVVAVVPDAIQSEDAACAYLYHLGYNAVLRSEARLGSKVVVIGLGVLGLGSVAMSVMSGAQVFGISNHLLPHKLAIEMGASACFNREQLSALHDILGRNRAHAVITTSNVWQDWRIALECAGYQGTIAVLGFPGRTETPVPFNPLDSAHFYARQLRIVAAGQSPENPDIHGFLPFNLQDNMKRILGWIGEGRLKPGQLISGEFSGEDIADAYEHLLSREGDPLTYLLRWKGYA